MAGRVDCFDAGGPGWITEFDSTPAPDESYRAEWREFLRCVGSDAEPLVTGEDALATLSVVEAARTSSATGCRTRLEVAR